MSNMNITWGERAALRLIVFWNPGNIGLDTNTAAQLKAYSNRVINELHTWYEKNNVENIPERFGNFMLLLPALAVKFTFLSPRNLFFLRKMRSDAQKTLLS
jgi:hypothetical protein